MRKLYDLTHRGSWGDKSLTLGSAMLDVKSGCSVDFRLGSWNNPVPIEGYTPGPGKGWAYTYCPGVEPRSFFEDLVAPTFGSQIFHVPGEPGWVGVPDVSSVHYDRSVRPTAWGELYTATASRFKWMGSERICQLDAFVRLREEMSKTRNIIVYGTWNPERARSIGVISDAQHESMKSLVREIDRACVSSPGTRLVLISKNAVCWPEILQSRFLDLRFTERDYNMPFSAALLLAAAGAHATVGEISSLQLWLTYDERPRHFSWSNGWNRGHSILDWVANDASRPSAADVIS